MLRKNTKYIFVTGGVLSGVGKGITTAAIGTCLKARGFSVNAQKLDPYLNVDAGTLNPAEHGECFVTADGAETDMDLGHYERFMDIELTQLSSMMSGRLLQRLIDDERSGKYLGKTVQVVPHFTDTIQDAVEEAGKGFDVHLVEIGGTVGDAESPAFFEAIREFSGRVGRENCLYVQVVYLPYLTTSKETKTKPAQNAVRELRSQGIYPDVIAARTEKTPQPGVLEKMELHFGIDKDSIAILPTAKTVYGVPLKLEETGVVRSILKKLDLKGKSPNLRDWEKLVKATRQRYDKTVSVGIIAKYMDNDDTYISVFEALKAAAWKHKVNLKIVWIDAEKIDRKKERLKLRAVNGIVVPGGFGSRGIEGKITAATYAINKKLPYLGLCLGLQVGVVAIARKSGLAKANSLEVDPKTPDPVIYIMPDQKGKTETGGTMRLGNYTCEIAKHTKAYKLYKQKKIEERHRHRYEVNNDYRARLEKAGMIVSGQSPDGNLVEMIELQGHPYFIASQFHPEFKSRPNRPHPLFDGFISALKKANA